MKRIITHSVKHYIYLLILIAILIVFFSINNLTFSSDIEKQTIADNQPIEKTGYSKTVFLEDYSTLGLKEDAIPGYVKKVNVRIAYKLGKDIKSVELSTVISKES